MIVTDEEVQLQQYQEARSKLQRPASVEALSYSST